MDNLKEFLRPKTFNKLSYVAAVCWIMFGVILLSVFADIENSEARFDFRCGAESEKKDLVRGKCFERYEHSYNKMGVPVFAFVIINFSLVGIVCVIYSQSVHSRVDQLLEAGDAERQRPPESHRLFVAYCCQLSARLTLVTIFIVLQTQLFYPSNFPSDFNCDLTSEDSGVADASAGRNTTTYKCHNLRAEKKTFWTNTMIAVNGMFAVFFLFEMIWILAQARKDKEFLEDSKFLANHLKCSCFPQNPPQQRPEEQVSQQEPEQVSLEIPLEELSTQPLSLFIESLKKGIIKDTERPTELKALFKTDHGAGDRIDLKLDNIYTKLVLIRNRAVYEFSGNREEQLKVYPAPRENFQSLKGPEDIADNENKMILVVGRPGIGKTLFCTKFMRDWANGKVFTKTQDTELYFDLALFVKFRKFNSAENLSLRQLFARSEYSQTGGLDDEAWKYILENRDRVLMLFDGLDEFLHISSIVDEKVNNVYKNSKEEDKMPVSSLYSKLVNGKLLEGATVVTTTRPTAVSEVIDLPFKKTIEILGFTSEQVKDYVENFTKNAAENLRGAGEKIWQHISTNMNLFSLCYIPVNCFIICSCLLQVLKFSTESRKDLSGVGLPTKLTQIYKMATKLFFFKHNEQYRDKPLSRDEIESDELPPEVEEKFKQLGKVAFDGVKERRLIFGKSEVQGLENSALFHQMPDRQIDPFKHEAQFCFIHLTMQEFFAAKHIVDTMKKKKMRRFVSKSIKKGEWHVVLQFVAGLLGERERPIEIFTKLLHVKTRKTDDGFTWWPTDDDKHLAVTIMKCLFESGENKESRSVVKSKLEEIGFNAVDFSLCDVAPSDCTAVVHALKNVPQISRINLSNNPIGSLGCVEIRKLLDNGNCQITELWLRSNNIDDNGVLELCNVITNSKLTWLDLSNNKITDVGVLELCNVITNSKLTWLDLSSNNITDVGVNNLCDVLTNPNCKLTWLHLHGNEAITAEAKHRIKHANPNCWVRI